MELIQLARDAYFKGVKIVNCCTTAEHLDIAEKYIGNYLQTCVMPSSGSTNEKFIRDYYTALKGILNERYKLLEI